MWHSQKLLESVFFLYFSVLLEIMSHRSICCVHTSQLSQLCFERPPFFLNYFSNEVAEGRGLRPRIRLIFFLLRTSADQETCLFSLVLSHLVYWPIAVVLVVLILILFPYCGTTTNVAQGAPSIAFTLLATGWTLFRPFPRHFAVAATVPAIVIFIYNSPFTFASFGALISSKPVADNKRFK